jgi:hypothetical protein
MHANNRHYISRANSPLQRLFQLIEHSICTQTSTQFSKEKKMYSVSDLYKAAVAILFRNPGDEYIEVTLQKTEGSSDISMTVTTARYPVFQLTSRFAAANFQQANLLRPSYQWFLLMMTRKQIFSISQYKNFIGRRPSCKNGLIQTKQ